MLWYPKVSIVPTPRLSTKDSFGRDIRTQPGRTLGAFSAERLILGGELLAFCNARFANGLCLATPAVSGTFF